VSVHSVDIVSEGATVSSLWESQAWQQAKPAPRPRERAGERAYRKCHELGLLEARAFGSTEVDADLARAARLARARQRYQTPEAGLALLEAQFGGGAVREAALIESRGQSLPNPSADAERAERVRAALNGPHSGAGAPACGD
jgi:hypothetical protein